MASAASSAGAILADFSSALKAITGDRRVVAFLCIRIFSAASMVIWGTYAMVFLTAGTGARMPEALIAFVPALSAVVTLAAVLLTARRMAGQHIYANMVIGQLIWLAGAAAFLASPARPEAMAALWTVLNAVSQVLFQPAQMSYWANIVDERQRAKIFSTATALITLCSLPVAPLAGYLYTLSPSLPFLFTISLQAGILGILLNINRKRPEPFPVDAN
jgi:hypothetical protein